MVKAREQDGEGRDAEVTQLNTTIQTWREQVCAQIQTEECRHNLLWLRFALACALCVHVCACATAGLKPQS